MRRSGFALLAAWVLGLAACSSEPPPLSVDGQAGDEPAVRVRLVTIEKEALKTYKGAVTLEAEAPGLRLRVDDRPVAARRRISARARGGSVWIDQKISTAVLRVEAAQKKGHVRLNGHPFPGRLELRARGDRLEILNTVGLEDYTLGVLRGELPLRKVPRPAAAAQAIAVRAYTMHHLARKNAAFDVDDSTRYQRYVGGMRAPDDGNLRAGVSRSRGTYLAYAARPLKAYYHSTCGDATTDPKTAFGKPNVLPLSGVGCDGCRGTKYHRWAATLSARDLLKAAGGKGTLKAVRLGEMGRGERPRQIVLETTTGTVSVNAADFRIRLGPSKLRSIRILELRKTDKGWHFAGAGWGHGVGLCQMGAVGLAQRGLGPIDIVRHYYPGAQVRRAY